MRRSYLTLAALFAFGLCEAVDAGLDVEAPIPANGNMELVVMEAPGCVYCTLFRRDVLPAYTASPRGKDLPIRFVDINDEAASAIGIDYPVDIVPTFVVLKNNKEVGRIPGYTGPEFFFHTINYLLSTAP
ncbi:MAG: thioredoxin fold domain-containing protein [Hyphomicrobium sp.]|nr:thioredoxin fold domain-containing protein [Hyphomicrobium sp.]